MEKNAIISELRKQAAGVGVARQKQEDAFDAEKIASAELLDAVVDAVRPALHAMCNRVDLSWDGLTDTGKPATFRGLHLWGRSATDHGLPSIGIYLSEHGDLIVASYTIGETIDSWMADFDLATSRKVVDLVGNDLAAILERIGLCLAAQARGAAARRTDRFVSRAERIRAAALLLRTA